MTTPENSWRAEGVELAAKLTVRGNIALVGFMTAGKSRVGGALARATGLEFVDLDAEIEARAGMPVHRIFETHGESHFRDLETETLRAVAGAAGRVLGCGGGTVLREENRRILVERSVRVWLRVSFEEVLRRLAPPDSPRRPLLEGKDERAVVASLMRDREPLYADADLFVDTDGRSVVEIAREIARRMALPVDADHRR